MGTADLSPGRSPGLGSVRVVQIRFLKCLGSATTPYEPLPSPLSSRPGFPATLLWTGLRVRLSLKERRMRFVNAIKVHRKSGGAKPRDLQLPGPLLETRTTMLKPNRHLAYSDPNDKGV